MGAASTGAGYSFDASWWKKCFGFQKEIKTKLKKKILIVNSQYWC